jgi:hypothetical protein
MRYVTLILAAALLVLSACGGEEAGQAGETEDCDTVTVEGGSGEPEAVPEPEELPEDPAEAAAEPGGGPQGTWSMTLGEMSLELRGDSVIGDYPLGTLRGTVDDRVLTFDYVEGNMTGTGMIQFDRTFESFTGWQLMGADTLEWSGERL